MRSLRLPNDTNFVRFYEALLDVNSFHEICLHFSLPKVEWRDLAFYNTTSIAQHSVLKLPVTRQFNILLPLQEKEKAMKNALEFIITNRPLQMYPFYHYFFSSCVLIFVYYFLLRYFWTSQNDYYN